MKALVGAVVAVVSLGVPSPTTQVQTMKLSDHVIFQKVMDVKQQERLRGWTATPIHKDRGPYPGSYEVVWTKGPGASAATVGSADTEYVLLGAAKLDPLPEVDVLGVHYIKVRPDRRDAFEKFVAEKLNPAVGNLRPDLRLLYYKAAAGEGTGSYITIFALTKASRDKYWPNGSDSDELKAAFTPSVKALATELQSYLVDGSFGTGMTAAVFESKEWADWAFVQAPNR